MSDEYGRDAVEGALTLLVQAARISQPLREAVAVVETAYRSAVARAEKAETALRGIRNEHSPIDGPDGERLCPHCDTLNIPCWTHRRAAAALVSPTETGAPAESEDA